MGLLLSLCGIVGTALCLGMYSAGSTGRIIAERPLFYLVNGLGAALVLVGAAHELDIGDLGTISQ